ncbi:MAG: hypothetical protein HC785_25850 [Calothrix sp. CSU_2_0]|nr:hypothetical protein [Calothrix sp. CSU_2_0]
MGIGDWASVIMFYISCPSKTDLSVAPHGHENIMILIPVATGQKFKEKIVTLGGRCDLHLFDNQEHGFFNKSPFREETIQKSDNFFDFLEIFYRVTKQQLR